MNNITRKNFETNFAMCDKQTLRYCETFASYISHIVNYFSEPLVVQEVKQCVFLIQRINLFIKDCPPVYEKFSARYKRIASHLDKCLTLNSEKYANYSIQQPSAN